MAFVHDIEADKIDSDFNLLTSFVKIPLVILGSVLGGSNVSTLEEDNDEDMMDVVISKPPCNEATENNADNADAMDCSSLAKALEESNVKTTFTQEPPSPSVRIVSDTDIDETDDSNGLKRSKKMSWSDSAGLRLVEYDDESLPHEPKIAPLRPTKSAMKKRGLIERDPAAASATTSTKRYIPKMGGAGMTMPSFSGSSGGSPALSNGYVSPEWGWYINTTPPTPEMYHNNSSLSAKKLTRTDPVGAPSFPSASASTSISCRRHKNTIFQDLQSSVTPNMGWTSVPI